MLRICLTAALVIALSGCSDPVGDAEEEHRIALRAGPSPDEKCQIERKLEAVYLSARREEDYQSQRSTAALACNEAALRRLGV